MIQSLKKFYNFIRKSEEKREQEKARFGKIFLGYTMIPLIIGFCLLANNAFKQSSWTQITASIVKSRIEEPPSSKRGFYALVITYSYKVAEKTFLGDGPIAHDSERASLEHKQEDMYTSGSNIQVVYNPSNPSESSLASRATTMPYLFLIIALLMTFISYKLIRTKPLPSPVPSENY